MEEHYFEYIQAKKIDRLEKWMARLQREMSYLKHVNRISAENKKAKVMQLYLFEKQA